jgi:integrase
MLAEGHVSGPVFCDTQGGPLRKSNLVRYSFHKIIARANADLVNETKERSEKDGRVVDAISLPRIRFHDLRHTCATLLLMANLIVKIVSERLGHSSIEMTLNTYSHVLPTMQKKAAEAMDGIFAMAAN